MSKSEKKPPDKVIYEEERNDARLAGEEKVPDKCPICKKVSKNVLLHISKKKSCCSEIDPVLYSKWKKEAYKRKKRKYVNAGKHQKDQNKYVLSGKHAKVQAKYALSGKHAEVQAKYIRKFKYGRCSDDEHKSHSLERRKIQGRYVNRIKINSGEYDRKRRLEDFKKLCLWILWKLKNNHICMTGMKKFHFVEADLLPDMLEMDMDDICDWVTEFETGLFSDVLIFQQVVLTTNTKWKHAITTVNSVESKKHLKDKLYKLIGKLQACDKYGHVWKGNVTDLVIPDEYKTQIKDGDDNWWGMPETLSKEHEKELEKLLTEFLGGYDEELLELLGLSKFLEKLEPGASYTNDWNLLN